MCLFVGMYVCIYVCIYVCMYVCVGGIYIHMGGTYICIERYGMYGMYWAIRYVCKVSVGMEWLSFIQHVNIAFLGT